METQNWKSPRKIAEEIRDYQRTRFEDYMCRVDEGELTRAIAIAALREEMDYVELNPAPAQDAA